MSTLTFAGPRRHGRDDPPLSELGMAEYDLVRTDADLHAADRRLADALAVDPTSAHGTALSAIGALSESSRIFAVCPGATFTDFEAR